MKPEGIRELHMEIFSSNVVLFFFLLASMLCKYLKAVQDDQSLWLKQSTCLLDTTTLQVSCVLTH